MKSQHESGAFTDRGSRGMNRRGSLHEFEESRVQINELQDMYTQLNRMVENLILRIADQEKRLSQLLHPIFANSESGGYNGEMFHAIPSEPLIHRAHTNDMVTKQDKASPLKLPELLNSPVN